MRPMIFPGVKFFLFENKACDGRLKNAEVPLKIVPFTPEALASPT